MAPYSNVLFFDSSNRIICEQNIDEWSVGVIMLELLVGTDIVIMASDLPKIKALLKSCKVLIGEEAYSVVHALMFGNYTMPLRDFLERRLKMCVGWVEKIARDFDRSLYEYTDLLLCSKLFKQEIEQYPEEMRDNYGIRKENVIRL